VGQEELFPARMRVAEKGPRAVLGTGYKRHVWTTPSKQGRFGMCAAVGCVHVFGLRCAALGPLALMLAREALRGLAAELEALDRRVKEIEVAIVRWHKDNEASRTQRPELGTSMPSGVVHRIRFSPHGRRGSALGVEVEQPCERVLPAEIGTPAIGGADRRVELVMGIVELGRPSVVEIEGVELVILRF
jgi:hypothetical protein